MNWSRLHRFWGIFLGYNICLSLTNPVEDDTLRTILTICHIVGGSGWLLLLLEYGKQETVQEPAQESTQEK